MMLKWAARKRLAVILLVLLGTTPLTPLFAKEYPGESIYHLKGEWLSLDNKTVQLNEMAGGVLALAMVYTSCEFSCPLIIEEFKRLKAKIAPENLLKVNFVLVSMDYERDTPAALKEFAKKRNLDLSFWRLYTAKNDKSIRELAAAIGVNFKKVGKEFAHSNLIAVIGPDGVIDFSKPNLGQQVEETAAAINKSSLRVQKK